MTNRRFIPDHSGDGLHLNVINQTLTSRKLGKTRDDHTQYIQYAICWQQDAANLSLQNMPGTRKTEKCAPNYIYLLLSTLSVNAFAMHSSIGNKSETIRTQIFWSIGLKIIIKNIWLIDFSDNLLNLLFTYKKVRHSIYYRSEAVVQLLLKMALPWYSFWSAIRKDIQLWKLVPNSFDDVMILYSLSPWIF